MRFALVGAGPIGISIARCALEKGHEILALVDVDPAKVGRPIAEVIGAGSSNAVVIDSIAELPSETEIVFHATGSSLAAVAGALEACLALRADVVSTCEELAYPWRTQPELAEQLDRAARGHGARLLGTGINPGFVMDILPLILTTACWEVRKVTVTRVLDASTRRLPFQQKVGVGLPLEEANERIAGGTFGHVGLPESAWMLSDRLGLGGVRLENQVEAVVSGTSDLVTGLHQNLVVFSDAGEVVRMRIEMVAGAADPRDAVELDADPPLALVIPGGVPGDAGTAAVIVNSAGSLRDLSPGLLCAADLPVPHAVRAPVAGEAPTS